MKEITNNKPTLLYILYHFVREVFLQGSIYGLVLTLSLYPLYLETCNMLSKRLGTYGTEQIVFTITVTASHIVVFYTLSTMFMLFDKFSLFQQYKMPRNKIQKEEAKELYYSTLIEVSVYLFILNPILAYCLHPGFVYFGSLSIYDPLPSTFTIAKSFVIAHVFNDVFFYYTHRLLHAKFYQFHKKHHEHHGPVSICAEYAHPIEALFSNVFPTLGTDDCISNSTYTKILFD